MGSIRQLSGLDKKGTEQKIKSQRGDVDVCVKQHIKWPHEYVLAGNTKDRIADNQLNITQWMAEFCIIMREKKCDESKDCMLDYLIPLLDDANDISRQSAKASHSVLLCQMEQGEISSWSETDRIDRVRHASAQRHTNGYQSSAPYQKSKKFQGQTQAKVTKHMPCVYYNDGSCSS